MRVRLQTAILTGLLAVATIAMTGCGAKVKGDKMIVKGKVTIDDKGAEGITLSFYGPNDKAASGITTTQADGSFEVMFNTAAGEGNYKVTASKMAGSAAQGEGIDDFQRQLGGGGKSLLPIRYNDINSSGLSTALQKGLNEGKNFALKSQ